MDDVLFLAERIQNTIRLGESDFREFKSAYEGAVGQKKPGDVRVLKRYIAEALVAFANSDGGELLIGVEDDGEISGVPHNPSEIQDMMTQYRDFIHPHTQHSFAPSQQTKLTIDGKIVLFFQF